MTFRRSFRVTVLAFGTTAAASILGACGSVATSDDAGTHSSSSSGSGDSSVQPVTGTPCGDAGLCAANEICVSFDENLAGEPEQRNDAGQAIPNQGPAFDFYGMSCVAVPAACSPLSCDCFTCPDTNDQGYQCVYPPDPGSPADAILSCSEPTG
jgi:hypothetical protein